MESVHRTEESDSSQEVEMTSKQGYYLMFYLLDQMYWENTENDTLGNILSSMNPYLFMEDVSADPAYWEDWQEMIAEAGMKEPLTVEQVLEIIQRFLAFYRQNFGFNLQAIEKRIKQMDKEDTLLKQCMEQAMEVE